MIEKTLVVLKPDAIARNVIGEIIHRFERTGLKLVGMKMVWIDEEFGKKHYFDVEERHGKTVFNNLIKYLTIGPVIAMCWEGVNAVSLVRKLVGDTCPDKAIPGTIRGDFSHITKERSDEKNQAIGNLIHASGKPEEAEYELKLWFTDEELHAYKRLDEDFVM